VFPISLTNALTAGEDRRAWDNSGAEAFVQRLIGLLTAPRQELAPPVAKEICREEPMKKARPSVSPSSASVILPSRVRPKSGGSSRTRLPPEAASVHLRAQEFLEVPGNV
jgi:hypothetical protein